MKFALILPAAGRGTRLGSSTPKALVVVGERPLYLHALRAFLSHPQCIGVVISAPSSHVSEFRKWIPEHEPVSVIAGGDTRQQSVAYALEALPREGEAVLIHDAVRPLVSGELIDRVLGALETAEAAAPGVELADTVKEIDPIDQRAIRTLSRERLRAIQTPQGIRTDIFREAHRLAGENGVDMTDDVSLVEHFRLGRVIIVPGDARNIKVTTAQDLDFIRWSLLSVPPLPS